MILTGRYPACAAASCRAARRCSDHAAGHVRTAFGRCPTDSIAVRATRERIAVNAAVTGISLSPSRIVRSEMRCFGFGSNRSGAVSARRSASLPVWSVPAGSRNTAEGITGEPSNRSGRVRPSGHTTTATVCEVPRSTLSR
jgi:hypothetical protein